MLNSINHFAPKIYFTKYSRALHQTKTLPAHIKSRRVCTFRVFFNASALVTDNHQVRVIPHNIK